MAENSTLSMKDYTNYLASVNIWKYLSPCLIIVGTFANILSIIVLLRKSMRNSTTMFYLTILAFGDLSVLYTGLLRQWLRHAFDIDLRSFSNFGCKLHVFLVYFTLDFSTWILVAVTIDRCISVCLPFKSRDYCTMKHAKIAVISICFLLCALNGHLFGTVALDGNQGCYGISSFILSVWPWIDLCAFCIGPFAVMMVCNIFIIRQIVMSNKRIESHKDPGGRNLKVELPIPSTSSAYRNGHVPKTNGRHSKIKRRLRKISHVTIMLLTVNIVYFTCTLPIAIYLIGYKFWVPGASAERRAALDLVWAISNFLQYTNNTIHFFMYCLTSPKFRKELFNLFDMKHAHVEFEHSAAYQQDKANVTKF
ncbi:Hypothetical predicted protein [Mytilus galloprovincialis]|uniref:G-protein coupled receptors family 1 profile domain-containing protein n=1 Tax=Mytilus galloprovincialis TaxID=29158 RepID=A0A8B6FA93_MYTGA|nr:Hypothetical predicted protein [Mytilus galloprovincialis]